MSTVGCSKKTGEQDIGKEEIIGAMPTNGEVRDPIHGREAWLAVGAIEGEEGTPANGVVTAHYFEDGTFILGMQVNIALPPDKSFYEAWLVPNDGNEWIPLGHLTSLHGDARHHVKFEAKEDYRKYLALAITLEKDDGNEDPSSQIAHALLKRRTR